VHSYSERGLLDKLNTVGLSSFFDIKTGYPSNLAQFTHLNTNVARRRAFVSRYLSKVPNYEWSNDGEHFWIATLLVLLYVIYIEIEVVSDVI